MTEISDTLNEEKQKLQDQLLSQCAMLSSMMREHQAAVVRLNAQRRKKIRQLRELDVAYRVIAEECGITDQAVFADLRKHKDD